MLLGNCKACFGGGCSQLGKLHFSIVAAGGRRPITKYKSKKDFLCLLPIWIPIAFTGFCQKYQHFSFFYCVFLVNPFANVTLCLCPSVSYLFCRKVASTSDFAPLTLHYTTFYTIHAQKKMPTNTLFGSDRNPIFTIATRFFSFSYQS